MSIDPAIIDEIKRSSDIVSYIGSRIKLKKNGKDFFGLCPFHKDSKPSLVVDQKKQLWNCLGACAANGPGKRSGGDIITFIMKYEGCSFPEAVRKLKPDLSVQSSRSKSAILCRVVENYYRSFWNPAAHRNISAAVGLILR